MKRTKRLTAHPLAVVARLLVALGSTSQFPAEPRILVDGVFDRCEGIAFNGEGDLYVAGNRALWRVSTAGEAVKIAEFDSNLGLALIGERDILMADFGPTNGFNHGPNDDGVVWRVTPEGDKSAVARGIGDPNFVLVLEEGSFLVSDDATDEIFHVSADGTVRIFSTAIPHPNGLALSADGATLYVAQIFQSIGPVVPDDRIWALPLESGEPADDPVLLGRTSEGGAPDGLAMDELGRVYAAVNGEGRIWRFDPATGERTITAENMPGAASIAFGQGDFDPHSIYVTSTRTGRVWVVPVGVAGAELHR